MKQFLAYAAALSVVVSAPVQAAEFIITYEGTVQAGGVNDLELFGAADLTGLPYIATFTLTYPPTAGAGDDTLGDSRQIYGAGASNPLAANLAINGVVFYITDDFGYLNKTNAAGNDGIHNVQQSPGTNFALYMNADDMTGATFASLDLLEPFTMLDPTGYGQFDAYDVAETHLTMDVAKVTGALVGGGPTPPVPEPATWTLLLAGFAAVGGAMRKRRPKVFVTYS